MPGANNATDEARAISTHFPFRRTIVVVETLVGLGGFAGSMQLLAGVATPPVSVLRPLGLSSWTLPAGWLLLTVALPSGLGLARVAALALGAGSRPGGKCTVGDRVAFPNSVSRFQRLAADLRHGGHWHVGRSILGSEGGLVATRTPDDIAVIENRCIKTVDDLVGW
jgi:hypothetical protein